MSSRGVGEEGDNEVWEVCRMLKNVVYGLVNFLRLFQELGERLDEQHDSKTAASPRSSQHDDTHKCFTP